MADSSSEPPAAAAPAAPAPAAAPALIPPNQTLYIRSLNEKIKKEELKKALYAMFSQHGQIMDVIALKTLKMRGQAFIVFKDIASATAALRQMQGFPFYDKPLNIQYAKGKSFAVGKLDGTYNELKRKRDEDREKEKEEEKQNRRAPPKHAKQTAPKEKKSSQPAFSSNAVVDDSNLPPNKILFLQHLPEDTPDQAAIKLTSLFTQFNGFREVRLVPGRHDIAFVEFDHEINAAVAKDSLQNFVLGPVNYLKITYAKR